MPLSRSLSPTEELFSKAFHASPVSLAILTAGARHFLEVNASFLRLTGFRREEVIGRTDLELSIWVEEEVRERMVTRLTERQAVHEVETRLRAKTGEIRHIQTSMELINLQTDSYVLCSIQDITARSDRELQIRHAQKMEAVGQLAAGFAHDFNNILAVVQGYAGLLLAEEKLEPHSTKALMQISTAAERAANLTRQLLAFSRKQVMQPKNVELTTVIGGLSNLLRRLLGDEISLKLSVSPHAPPVYADALMLEQSIMNLAVNARDAMPTGGVVTISADAVEVSQEYVRSRPDARVGRFACIALSDTGCGMEPITLHRIFEPFFTTKEVGKGTGLGLATVYGIVKQHNGWIEVASQPGQGTTFKLFLAAAAKSEKPPIERPAFAPVLGGKEKILMVEDEPGLQTLVQGILERYGYSVVRASNGVEALQAWEDHRGQFDLVLTDMVMPGGISGRELAEKLKAHVPHLKVIYTSGYSADLMSEGIGGLHEGINFLQKPYRPQTLAQTVRTCLDAKEKDKTSDKVLA